MRLAIFKNIEYGYITYDEESFEEVPGYVRLSEYADIDFPDRDTKEVVNEQLDALDNEAKEATAAYQMKLTNIEQRKSELLALTHEAAA